MQTGILAAGASDYIRGVLESNIKDFISLQKTYFNNELSDDDKKAILGMTLAYLIQTSAKRLSKDLKEEEELLEKLLRTFEMKDQPNVVPLLMTL